LRVNSPTHVAIIRIAVAARNEPEARDAVGPAVAFLRAQYGAAVEGVEIETIARPYAE